MSEEETFEPLQVLEHTFPDSVVKGFLPDVQPVGRVRAWEMNGHAMLAAKGKEKSDATIAGWIIEAPWAHPVWHSYWLHVVHTRQLERDGEPLEPVHIYLPGATHEMWLHALEPEADPEEVARSCKPFDHALIPINFASQLILPDDGAACQLAFETARDVLQGRLNPDTDAIQTWAARYGDNMMLKGEAADES